MKRAPVSLGAIAYPLAVPGVRTASVELARRLIVLGCAAALILAGQSLPF
jgi:hypothetical protein